MQRSEEFQFELQGLGSTEEIGSESIHPTGYDSNHFREVLVIEDMHKNGETIMRLQNTIKSQHLILSNEEKHKGLSIKRLECEIQKCILKFIEYRMMGVGEDRMPLYLLNVKDLQDLHHNLDDTLRRFMKDLYTTRDLMRLLKDSKLQPTSANLDDLVNFFPNFMQNMYNIVAMEVEDCGKIGSLFDSEYSFGSKVLSHLRRRYELEVFAQKLLERGVHKLKSIRFELVTDFSQEYDRIREALSKHKNLRHFVQDKGEWKQAEVEREIEEVLQTPSGQEKGSFIFKYVQSVCHDPNISHNMKQEFMRRMEVTGEHVNVKVGLLTLKSLSMSKQEIEDTVTLFAEDMLAAIDAFPLPMRQIARVFEDVVKTKFGEKFKSDILQDFIMKSVFSRWIFTELMRHYQQVSPSLTMTAKNTNFSVICQILQKILHRQPFFETEKLFCFNQLIQHFKPQSELFFKEFNQVNSSLQERDKDCRISIGLLSFQTIRYLLAVLRENVVEYIQFQEYHLLEGVFSKAHYQIFNQKYSAAQLFVLSVDVESPTLTKVFEPKVKINRLIIDFLEAIPYMGEPIHLYTLVEQYKYSKDLSNITKIPIELYANYLNLLITPTKSIDTIAKTIEKELDDTKMLEKRIRILLEVSTNYYISLQKMFSELILSTMKIRIKEQAVALMGTLKITFRLIHKPRESLTWEIGDNPEKRSDKSLVVHESLSVRSFLRGIARIYMEEEVYQQSQCYLGINEAYNTFVQTLTDLVIKQNLKNLDLLLPALKDSMGEYLFDRLKLNFFSSKRDEEVFRNIMRVQFVGLEHLEPKYSHEEELFLMTSRPYLQLLKEPSSPEGILQKILCISTTFQHIILSIGKPSDITADIQIPLMLFIMIKARMPNLFSLSNFSANFCLEETVNSILGQTMTLFRSVVLLLETINGAKLGISEEEFQRLSNTQ